MKWKGPASAGRCLSSNGLTGPRSPSPVLPAVDTSGFCESQIGVLSPKVLRHLVWTTVSLSVALRAPSNGAQVQPWTLEMNALLMARPVCISLECLGASGVVAQNNGWPLVDSVGCIGWIGTLPVVRSSGVRHSTAIPHVAPIGLTLHGRGFTALLREEELVTKISIVSELERNP
jgi:hypothetical protein